MNDNNTYVDPLEKLLEKYRDASESIEKNEDKTNDVISEKNKTHEDLNLNNTTSAESYQEIDYGDDDVENEIKRENELESEKRKEMMKSVNENKSVFMPPNEYDMNYNREAVDFQATNISIVTTMVNKVIAKYHIITGGVPEQDIPDKKIFGKLKVMGELMESYHNNGEVITPEFENILLSNWILDNGMTALESLIIKDTPTDKVSNNSVTERESDNKSDVDIPENPIIYVDVHESSNPVNITVDDSIIPTFVKSNKINIHVRQVSDKDIDESKVILDSNQSDIIKPYVSERGDCPVALPMSAYRCVMTPITWFESLNTASPTSNNPIDLEIKKWTTIYNHMKNISIGDFENFDDFLKKTKYQDGELLMWGILVGSSEDTIEIGTTCSNILPNGDECKTYHSEKYDPRSILHLDEKLIPESYRKTCDVAPGPDAVAHWENHGMDITRYVLPESRYIVEINDPSAYEWLTNRLPAMQEALKKYAPHDRTSIKATDDPRMTPFNYLAAHISTIHAIIIPSEDGKSYKYTRWENIEKIITTGLSTTDTSCLLKIVNQSRDRFTTPVSFYIENLKCSNCGHISPRVNITNIQEQLLFQQSQALNSTEVNWIETE